MRKIKDNLLLRNFLFVFFIQKNPFGDFALNYYIDITLKYYIF